MSDEEKKYCDQFLDIAKANDYSFNVVFAMGAIAFDKGTTEEVSIKILKHMIDLATKYKNEDDFVAEVEKAYIEQ